MGFFIKYINCCLILTCILAIRVCSCTYTVSTVESTLNNGNNSNSEKEKEDASLHWRLPNTSYPLSYDIHITTNLHRREYDYIGNCSIMLQVQHDTAELYLHAKHFNITAVTISELCENAADVVCNQFNGHVAYETITDILIISNNRITFKSNRRYLLNILYVGVIATSNTGFHQITETDTDNSTVIGAMTQFEPTHARSFLPCYDEPGLKAIFKLSITHASNYTVISNMPQLGQSIESAESSGLTTTHFMPTPPMSTYLLALVIFAHGSYVNYTTTTENQTIPQRIFIHNSLVKTADIDNSTFSAALAIAESATKALVDYFEYPYVLPKLDHISVTKMYGAGMENWGLITYQFNTLLKANRQEEKWQRFALIGTMYHEIIHQWLGNLITPKWWDHIWLNEGFASYFSFKIMNLIQPEFDSIKLLECGLNFIYSDKGNAIVNYVEKQSDIKKIFGRSIYSTAPCMIQMFDYALGENIFHKGLNLYIQRHAYTAVTEQQLYDALQTVANEYYSKQLNRTWSYQLDNIFKTWTHSKSYPVVTISRDEFNSNILKIHQKSYNATAEGNLWWIPLKFATSAVQQEHIIFMPPIADWSIDVSTLGINLTTNDWIIVSMENKAIYRIIYDSENMRHLAAALNTKHEQINYYERTALLSQQAQNLQYYTDEQVLALFELLKYLEHESDVYVWNTAAVVLSNILKQLKQMRSIEAIKMYFERLTKPIFSKYPIKDGKKVTLSILESNLIYLLNHYLGCFIDMPTCLQREKTIFLKEFTIGLSETEDMACVYGKNLNYTMFFQLSNVHFYENNGKLEDETLMNMLKCVKDDELYEEVLLKVLGLKMCSRKYSGLNIFLTDIEFKRVRTTLQIVNDHIDDVLIQNGELCAENEQFLKKILSHCLKAEAFELSNIMSLCLQHSLSSEVTDAYDSTEFYNALDEKLYVWLSKENAEMEKPSNKLI